MRIFSAVRWSVLVSIGSVNGQWMAWSDGANAQADLGIRCPHKR